MEHCRREGITPSECGRRGGLTAAANRRKATGTQEKKTDPLHVQTTMDLGL